MDSVKNILTFRYDPNDEYKSREKHWSEFTEQEVAPEGHVLENMLIEKISEKINGHDRIAISLSSGIDSQLVYGLVKKICPEKNIDLIHYEGINPEIAVVRNSKNPGDVLHVIKNKSLLDMIPEMVQILNKPFWDAFNMTIFRKAAELDCDLLLTGDGADEILSGYTFRYENYHPMSYIPFEKATEYMKCHSRDWLNEQEHLFGYAINFNWEDTLLSIQRHFDNPLSAIRQCFLADFNGKLTHNFIPRDEMFSQHFKIEKFSPYLDYDVMRYCNHLSSDSKISGSVGKIPLRNIALRNKIESTSVKYGFSYDVKSELKTDRGSKIISGLRYAESRIYEDGLINPQWVERNYNNTDDVNVMNKLMQLYALEIWLNQNV